MKKMTLILMSVALALTSYTATASNADLANLIKIISGSGGNPTTGGGGNPTTGGGGNPTTGGGGNPTTGGGGGSMERG